ncbi:tetratricopeptide repeat protein [Thermomonas brevis]
MALIAAICPQCGGNLQVPDDRDVVACMYCRTDVIVRQAIHLIPGNTKNLLELAEAARNAGNTEEAISYYNRVLENDPKNSKAWFGKGVAAGWSSTLANFRFQEMIAAFETSIKNTDGPEKPSLLVEIANEINQIATACAQISRQHLIQFISLIEAWDNFISQSRQIVFALETAHRYDPNNKNIIENIIQICKTNANPSSIEGKLSYSSNKYDGEVKELMAKYVQEMRRIDPSYTPPRSNGCFVVTATLGDENHPSVNTLRQFREEILSGTPNGEKFIHWYYENGPKFAKIVEGSKFLRRFSYFFIVTPAVFFAKPLLHIRRKRNK